MFIVKRSPNNPLLAPRREHPWEAVATFNPSVIREGDGIRMYYRALAAPDALVAPNVGESTIGMAESVDGINFYSRKQVLVPQDEWDAYGCEDPRATVIDGTTYLSYTALGGFPFSSDNIRIAIAVSKDGITFPERHLATTFNAKAFSIFPEKVGDDYVALLTVHTDMPPAEICVVRAKRIEDFWSPAFWDAWYLDWKSHALPLKRSHRDHVEVGSVPIATSKGWLIFYSYIENYFGGGDRVFAVEAALLDLENPEKIISRTYPLLVPEEIYELYGVEPNIIFPTSVLENDDGTIDLYYGAADTTCAKATIRLADLLQTLDPEKPAQTLVRAPENPLLVPIKESAFESVCVFNPAVFMLDDAVHIIYRAMGHDRTSVMGYARSKDGIHIDERLAEPIYVPRADFEMKKGDPNGNSGCEDPRVVIIGDRIYMTYTAYDGVRAPRGAITSISIEEFRAHDFDKWTMPMLVTPDSVDDKDVVLLPEAVNGEYVLYHRISGRVCCDLVTDLTFEKRVSRCIEILAPREGMWDAAKVGLAGPPIKVEGGWLLIYHGVSHTSHYRLGAALLDPTGTMLLARSADPILEPIELYEREGDVPGVVFSCGQVVKDDTLYLYYGGADTVVGVARGSISKILAALN